MARARTEFACSECGGTLTNERHTADTCRGWARSAQLRRCGWEFVYVPGMETLLKEAGLLRLEKDSLGVDTMWAPWWAISLLREQAADVAELRHIASDPDHQLALVTAMRLSGWQGVNSVDPDAVEGT